MSPNSVCNHTRDKQNRLPLRGRPILLSLVSLQTELDSTQPYYHYLSLHGGNLTTLDLFDNDDDDDDDDNDDHDK